MWTALVSWGETLGFMDVFFLRRRADRILQLSSHHTMILALTSLSFARVNAEEYGVLVALVDDIRED